AVAALVEADQLHQRDADALGQAAVDLALDDGRVDARAAIVDGDEPAHLHIPGAGVDVDHADVGAVGIGEVTRVVGGDRLQVRLDVVRHVRRGVGPKRDLLDRLTAVGRALYEPAALLPLEVGRRGLQHRGRDQLRLVAHLTSGD